MAARQRVDSTITTIKAAAVTTTITIRRWSGTERVSDVSMSQSRETGEGYTLTATKGIGDPQFDLSGLGSRADINSKGGDMSTLRKGFLRQETETRRVGYSAFLVSFDSCWFWLFASSLPFPLFPLPFPLPELEEILGGKTVSPPRGSQQSAIFPITSITGS